MSKERFSIVQADCLDWLRAQPDNSVDLIFGSPPYEAARTYGIDFKLRGQDWVDWMVARMVEMVRVSRGLVAMVVEGQTCQFRWSAAPALLMADLHRAGVHLRKPPAFHRVGIPGSGGPDWLRNDYEFIVCCTSGGKLPWSDSTAMGHPPKWAPGGEMSHRISDGQRVNQWGKNGSGKGMGARNADGTYGTVDRPSHVITTKKRWGEGGDFPETKNGDALRRRKVQTKEREGQHNQEQQPVLANPGNEIQAVYQFTAEQLAEVLDGGPNAGNWQAHLVGGGLMGDGICHENEAPFPESLAEMFVRSFCPPEGIVCDPFSGSGTVAKVALTTGRRFTGCDIRESQVELTRRRVNEIQMELFA